MGWQEKATRRGDGLLLCIGSLEVCLLPHAKVRLGQGLEVVALAITLPHGPAESLGREGCLYFAFVLSFKPFVSMEHLFSFGENLKLAVTKYIRIYRLGLRPEPCTAFPHMHRSVGGKILF